MSIYTKLSVVILVFLLLTVMPTMALETENTVVESTTAAITTPTTITVGDINVPIPNDLSQTVTDTTSSANVLNPNSGMYAGVASGEIVLPRKDNTMISSSDILPRGMSDYLTMIRPLNGKIIGTIALQQIHPDLELPPSSPDRTLYAPTLKQVNSPLEITTAYWRYNGMSGTGRGIGIWDFRAGRFVVFKFNSDTADYIYKDSSGNQFYVPMIKKFGSRWYALLLNFKTLSFEIQYSVPFSREDVGAGGWDMWESYFEGTCPDIPDIESNYLMVFDIGGFTKENSKYIYTRPGWKLVTQKYGYLWDYLGCDYRKEMKKEFWNWIVGPNILITLE